mmetsp:Transcript_9740/g.17161  ORF Transcript_9740/g.17161 Transcript_9740/m.17161 type:complete len:239 (-) Transcript_9740:2281-2997(-)
MKAVQGTCRCCKLRLVLGLVPQQAILFVKFTAVQKITAQKQFSRSGTDQDTSEGWVVVTIAHIHPTLIVGFPQCHSWFALIIKFLESCFGISCGGVGANSKWWLGRVWIMIMLVVKMHIVILDIFVEIQIVGNFFLTLISSLCFISRLLASKVVIALVGQSACISTKPRDTYKKRRSIWGKPSNMRHARSILDASVECFWFYDMRHTVTTIIAKATFATLSRRRLIHHLRDGKCRRVG